MLPTTTPCEPLERGVAVEKIDGMCGSPLDDPTLLNPGVVVPRDGPEPRPFQSWSKAGAHHSEIHHSVFPWKSGVARTKLESSAQVCPQVQQTYLMH